MLGAALLLSACFPYAPKPGSAYPRAAAVGGQAGDSRGEGKDLDHLILYVERTRRLAPAGLESEYAAARAEHRRAPDSFTRLKLGLLLSSPRVSFRDYAFARQLLHAATKDADAEPTTRAAAALWLHELEERIALERSLEEERRQRQTLQRKLDQLKTIEEEIDRRPATPVVPR